MDTHFPEAADGPDLRFGKLIAHLVVVGDDQLQAELPCESSLLDARDSAIHRNQQPPGILLVELPDGVAVESVTFFQTGRNVIVYGPSGQLQAVQSRLVAVIPSTS
jgi:hypothetical protein